MEGSDAFGTEVGSTEDPFAGGEDWSGFGGESSEEGQPATAELKQVDREGNAVESSDTRSKLERMEDSYQYASSHGEPVSEELRDAHLEFERQKGEAAQDAEFEAAAPQAQTDAIVSEDTTLPQSDAERAQEIAPDPNASLKAISEREAAEKAADHNEKQAATDAQEAADAAGRAVEEVQAAEAERETAESPAAPAEATEEPAPEPEPAQPQAAAEAPAEAEAEPTPDVDEPQAPEPEERQSGGKTTHRRYFVLHNTAPGKFEQVTWYEDKDGKMVPKGTAGAKRQGVAVCRGTEDALKKGHAALGSPTETVNLVAVAALHFQPRPVAPEPVEPTRVRLKIG